MAEFEDLALDELFRGAVNTVTTKAVTAEDLQRGFDEAMRASASRDPVPVAYVVHPTTFAEHLLAFAPGGQAAPDVLGLPVYEDSDAAPGAFWPLYSAEDMKRYAGRFKIFANRRD